MRRFIHWIGSVSLRWRHAFDKMKLLILLLGDVHAVKILRCPLGFMIGILLV